MKPSWRIYFLIGVSAVVFHLRPWTAGFVLAGYVVFEWLDQWLARRAKRKAIEEVIQDETDGWEPDAEDPEYESKGDWQRPRLTGKDQVIVSRVAGILRRLP